jgi:hypothetical protein
MRALSAILLGLINIAIVVALLMVIGAIAEWILDGPGFRVSEIMQKLFLVLVALVALYMLVALIVGGPTLLILTGSAL